MCWGMGESMFLSHCSRWRLLDSQSVSQSEHNSHMTQDTRHKICDLTQQTTHSGHPKTTGDLENADVKFAQCFEHSI